MMLESYETDRLLVRPLIAEDLDLLFRLVYADPRVAALFTSYTTYEQVVDLHRRKVAANAVAAPDGFGSWGVVPKLTGVLIGQVLLGPPEPVPWIELPETSPALPLGAEVEMGYAFGYDYWGQGYATEACTCVVGHAFDRVGLGRLVNCAAAENARSIRLMVRLGFRVEPNLNPGDNGVVGILTPELFRNRPGR
jgi:ribosomal-protein-alanine N-acetyltransferase